MNEEIVKDYERDMLLFINLAANAKADSKKSSSDIEASMCIAAANAFELAANQMLYRLESWNPDKYLFVSIVGRNEYIKGRIKECIKENTNAQQT